MDNRQLKYFGIGLFILGLIILLIAPNCFFMEGDFLLICEMQKYLYFIPGSLMFGVGIMLTIVSFIKPKKEQDGS